ncbi:uncharacterized protein LOC108624516 [Ceratina calcarata]|uniref:Uncharacterized protein LOC108624516 n=1 Tax=Ceratina calcarata TaxID=156304 RepID=A0AAJ7N626_9HYME|nr:uncharacterized protein LOC108624516 [Ceratina calcarata]
MKIFAIVLAVVLVSVKAAPSDGTAPGSSDVKLTDLIQQAQTNINNLATQIQEQLNIPDQDTIVKTVKEQSSNFVTTMQEFMKNMTEEAKKKSPELEGVWNDVKAKITEGIDSLSTTLNAETQVAELKNKFQQGVETVLTESNNAAKNLSQHSGKIQEDLAKITKQAVDIAVEATQNLNKQLQQAAATPKS